MLKNELKAALAVMGTVFVPLMGQADQSMNSNGQMQNGTQSQQAYVPGEMVRAGQLPGAYNQSADYMCESGWDVFLTGNYIYWDWAQDVGLSLGVTSPDSVTSLGNVTLNPQGMTPGYASGFQVGLGFNMHGMDDWNFYAEYTWYKNSSSGANDIAASIASPAISVDLDVDASVSMNYSNADFLLQRPFYFGKKLTANFFTGLKALWITQEFSADLDHAGSFSLLSRTFLNGTVSELSVWRKTSSWGLGPKFGLDSSWLLGYGFKILSNISASVLYTRYTQNADLDMDMSLTMLSLPVNVDADLDYSDSSYGTIRPIAEAFLGLGWGSFFCDNDFHFDLSVGYDFNVYWDYVLLARGAPASNMYLHGLNIQARFDF